MLNKIACKLIFPVAAARGLSVRDSDYEILTYKMELILANAMKFAVLLVFAADCDLVPEIAVFMITYTLLRLWSFGIHLEHDLTCLLIGLVYYIGSPYLARVLDVSDTHLVYCFAVILVLFYRYAPAGTKIRRIGFFERARLRNISCTGVFLVYLTAYFSGGEVRSLLVLASLAQTANILPCTYWAVDKIHHLTQKKGAQS